MKYKSEVPKPQQIKLNEFPLLPGDKVVYRDSQHEHLALVVEVGSANPEYVLGGPKAKDAGVIRWTVDQRDECKSFLRGGHLPVPIRLKKSMWAVIEFSCPPGNLKNRKLYTYTILNLRKRGHLQITEKG